jgi:hypothetical protein
MASSAVVGIGGVHPAMRAFVPTAGAGANRVVTLPTEATQRGRALCVLFVGRRIGHGLPPFQRSRRLPPAAERRATPPVRLVLLVGRQPHSHSPRENLETPAYHRCVAAPQLPPILNPKHTST